MCYSIYLNQAFSYHYADTMQMKFLLTWELGRGHGHQLQLEKLCSFLIARGHSSVIYSPDHTALTGESNAQYPTSGLKSWADLLLGSGFSDLEFTAAKLDKWRLIFQQEKPDAIIADHAPFALIAAYGMQIPRIEFGSAFTIPSRGNPTGHFDNSLPPFNEDELISKINTLLAGRNWSALDSLDTLYACSMVRCATGIPLLDHYGPRKDIAYTGAFASGTGISPTWRDQNKIKLFIYWRDGIGLEPFLLRLNPTQFEVNAYVPAGLMQTRWPAHWIISNKPWDLNAFIHQTKPDVALGYASNAFTQWMAHLGIPQLMAPLQREGLMQAARAQQLGLGLLCSHSNADDMVDKLRRLIASNEIQVKTRAFSEYSKSQWNSEPRFIALCELIEKKLKS